jgi:hypothetical protein
MRVLNTILLSAALLAPLGITPVTLRADDRLYRDEKFHDEHRWDSHEDRAYRMWVKERHRRYEDFQRLRAEDQAAYWAWRHKHSDAVLHIDIR